MLYAFALNAREQSLNMHTRELQGKVLNGIESFIRQREGDTVLILAQIALVLNSSSVIIQNVSGSMHYD